MKGSPIELRELVREHYARAAVDLGEKGCCSPGKGACCTDGYRDEDLAGLPRSLVATSFGCGIPTRAADLAPGESVLDLGSGGGLDVILAARRVGARGFVYGLDMTDEMLDLARRQAEAAGVGNVKFLKGFIEAIPLPDRAVDVVLSNCVINLSTDKAAVFREVGRVLRSGGRLAIADMVADDQLSPTDRARRGSYAGCIAGALSKAEYRQGLEEAGFQDVSIEATDEVTPGIWSAVIRAVRPS